MNALAWHGCRRAPDVCAPGVQETLEAGCKNVDDVVASLKHVSLKDRSMVWNTDLCEVPSPSV